MSDGEWDADNFEAKQPVVSDKWEGEDEDDEVRDNWDDEDEADKKDETISAEASAVQIKKKKPLKERLAEKEEKRKKDLEEKRKQEEEAKKQLTPKQLFEEKLRRQKIQEEADLALAVEAFGFGKEEPVVVGVLDGFEPKTKEDFDKFSQMLCEKITQFEKSPYYVPFMETFVCDVTLAVGPDDLKKLSSTLTALYNEKVKLQKSTKGKKKTKKATLTIEKNILAVNEDNGFDDFDDYL